jgi:hypothetical protein
VSEYEYEEGRTEGEVDAVVPHLSIHQVAQRLGISVEAAHALVEASLKG